MARVTAHFGEWVQGRVGNDIALITMVCPPYYASEGDGAPLFSQAQLTGFSERLGVALRPARCNFAPGIGAGASTASLVAMARDYSGTPEELAQACLEVEGAVDPLMFAHPDELLWASRAAKVLRHLPPPPRAEIIGGSYGPPVKTDPQETGFSDVSDLVADWPTADLPKAAKIASHSASRRGPLGPMDALVTSLGALGHCRAHTGSLRGLIFAPGTVPPTAKPMLEEAGLKDILQFETGSR